MGWSCNFCFLLLLIEEVSFSGFFFFFFSRHKMKLNVIFTWVIELNSLKLRYVSDIQLRQYNGCLLLRQPPISGYYCWFWHSLVSCWAQFDLLSQKKNNSTKKCLPFFQISELNYLSEGLASIKAGARNEAGRSVWHGDKEVYGKVGWSSRSTPSGSSEIPQGQLALKLWQSRTCLSFSVLPVFCLEHNKKLICM